MNSDITFERSDKKLSVVFSGLYYNTKKKKHQLATFFTQSMNDIVSLVRKLIYYNVSMSLFTNSSHAFAKLERLGICFVYSLFSGHEYE